MAIISASNHPLPMHNSRIPHLLKSKVDNLKLQTILEIQRQLRFLYEQKLNYLLRCSTEDEINKKSFQIIARCFLELSDASII